MEIITASAVIVALLKDNLKSLLIGPALVITASNGPEHFHEAPATDRSGQFVEDQAWLGVILENHGLGTAKNVSLFFNGIRSNRIVEFGRFRSIPLCRSWIGSPVLKLLHRNIPVRFDICYLGKPNPNTLRFSLIATPNALSSVNCPFQQESYFEFEVVAMADNARVASKRGVRISYYGNYIQGFTVQMLEGISK